MGGGRHSGEVFVAKRRLSNSMSWGSCHAAPVEGKWRSFKSEHAGRNNVVSEDPRWVRQALAWRNSQETDIRMPITRSRVTARDGGTHKAN